jgi:hypothetical protein
MIEAKNTLSHRYEITYTKLKTHSYIHIFIRRRISLQLPYKYFQNFQKTKLTTTKKILITIPWESFCVDLTFTLLIKHSAYASIGFNVTNPSMFSKQQCLSFIASSFRTKQTNKGSNLKRFKIRIDNSKTSRLTLKLLKRLFEF